MLRAITSVVALAVGAAAAFVVARHVAARLPSGWAEVVVLGRDDAPIEGVTLKWDWHGPPAAQTNAMGVARLDLTERGGKASVVLGGTLTGGSFEDDSNLIGRKVRAPRTVIRLPNAIPFDVNFVDARDGRPLSGGRVGWPYDAMRSARPASDVEIRGLVNDYCDSWVEAEAPAGFVLPDETLHVEPIIAAFVRRQRMVIPVWPAGRIRVRVLETDGRPATGPLRFAWSLGWPEREWEWTRVVADAEGQFESASLPLMPGADVRVHVQHEGDVVVGGRPRTAVGVVRIVEGRSDYEAELSLPMERDGGRCSGGTARWPYPEPLPGGDAALRLRVLRSDGTPARRVRVLLRSADSSIDPRAYIWNPSDGVDWTWQTEVLTDDAGRASKDGLTLDRARRQDAVRVILAEPGCTYTEVVVPLPPGEIVNCELRESIGEEIDLTVVDADGLPVPWARVSAETLDGRDWTWSPVEDGVQVVAPRTGLDGRIVLRGLPPGLIWVEAVSSGRRAKERLFAGQRDTLRVR